MLERKRFKRDRLFLYTQKTGTPVYVPLPPELVAVLNSCSNRNPEYFFWSGESKLTTAAGNQRKYLNKLFKLLGFEEENLTGSEIHSQWSCFLRMFHLNEYRSSWVTAPSRLPRSTTRHG